MFGHMRFVHTVEVDNDENRRLSYEGALSQLNELLNNGMQDGTFLELDVPEEERIITGMTFIPEGTDNSESWGTAGTAPVNPGQGIENTPPVDVVPIGPFPDSSTKGRNASVSYGLYGLFFLVAIALVVGIGVIMRRRQNKDGDDEDWRLCSGDFTVILNRFFRRSGRRGATGRFRSATRCASPGMMR